MSTNTEVHKPASLSWPFAVKRMIEAAAPPPPSKSRIAPWRLIGLK